MNSTIRGTFINSNTKYFPLRVTCALFHSTPILERKRRNFWDSSWKEDVDEDDPSSSQGTSWFRKRYSPKGSQSYRNGNHRSRHWFRRSTEFSEDDADVETIFRSAFGRNRSFYWSFVNEENPQWRTSGGFSDYGKSFNQRHRRENAYDSSPETEFDSSYSDSVSDRLALGLNASGPLKLEDVKNAYRACALKWHPDRHKGSSKVIAEEKFKHCSAVYQSLCDKLTLD